MTEPEYRDIGGHPGPAPLWFVRQLIDRAEDLLTEGDGAPEHAARLARWLEIVAEVRARG